MSTFVTHLHHDLSSKILLPSTPTSPGTPGYNTQSKEALRTYYLELRPPTSLHASKYSLQRVQHLREKNAFVQSSDTEEEALRISIAAKLTVGIYTQFLDMYLNEASDAEAALEWWSDVERSRWRAAYFLLQTSPVRIMNLSRTIIRTVRNQNIPLQLSVFTPSSLRQLFPSRNILHPNALTVALFPHLRHEPYSASAVALHPASASFPPDSLAKVESFIDKMISIPMRLWGRVLKTVDLPIRLARHECEYKRKELTKIRDDRAAVLGSLMALRDQLTAALESTRAADLQEGLVAFCTQCSIALAAGSEAADLMNSLEELTNTTLPTLVSSHASQIKENHLRRPSRLVLIWPKLVFLPPLALYTAKLAYNSRESLDQIGKDALATVKGFWDDWLLGPLKDVVRTVRAGSDDGIIVTRESVKADLDSLERMALSLAKDKLNYTPEQMTALSQQVRAGDLTPVMQIYEDDIKSPLRSAVGGSLLRTLLVQVQKAKVDIDQTLSGIDKLLKSQELTFAFVGVAPALTIVYGTFGYLRNLWTGSKGNGRFGGRKRRTGTWLAVRRIERLLIADSVPHDGKVRIGIDPRTSGLLLLSTTQLRKYAETQLPTRSRLREGFLEDVSDLEDPSLGRAEKLRVLDRMWKSWGQVLGWHRAAIDHHTI